MKILVISLLRLGDIITHRQLAQSLRNQYPGSEIHFLIYSQFQSVSALLPEVNRWHALDRQEIQKILVERDQSPLQAYRLLEKTVAELNHQKFDLVLNATHNRFSVRMMDLIEAREKRGVALEKGQKVMDQNRWQTYLNENFSEVRGSQFHYLEVLQKSLELSFRLPEIAEKRNPKLILIQLLTSDTKKNWGLQKFHELKKRLEKEFPQDRVFGLCSMAEKEQVQNVFGWNEFLTPSLEEAAQLLKEARLLVTGDTSIQHLAAQQGCQVVSLFLGSADPVKTAPWQTGAYVIQGQADCAPCSHASACHQASHLCGEALSVESVFALVEGVLKEKEIRIFSSQVYRTEAVNNSFSVVPADNSFRKNLEQAVWSAYLNNEQKVETSHLTPMPGQLRSLIHLHEKFKMALQNFKIGKIEIKEIESQFPLWKDSLIRLKRNANDMAEALELIQIRTMALNELSQDLEVSQNGSTRSNSQEHFATA